MNGRLPLIQPETARARKGEADDPLAAARDCGLSDEQIAEVIAHVALNVFTNYLTTAARVDIDWPLVRHTEGIDMTVVRNHHYTVAPSDVEELIARRAALIASIRAAHPGLIETRLTRLEDGTFTDVWRWESAEQMGAAFAALPSFPEARAAMSLTRDATAQNGQILDEES